MPICPECRAGYDEQSECPECGMPAPVPTSASSTIRTATMRCSRFGAFCIFSAWVGSILMLILFAIATVKSASTLTEWALALLTAILHLGICYALWLALDLATETKP